jgi:hypothetical protein
MLGSVETAAGERFEGGAREDFDTCVVSCDGQRLLVAGIIVCVSFGLFT